MLIAASASSAALSIIALTWFLQRRRRSSDDCSTYPEDDFSAKSSMQAGEEGGVSSTPWDSKSSQRDDTEAASASTIETPSPEGHPDASSSSQITHQEASRETAYSDNQASQKISYATASEGPRRQAPSMRNPDEVADIIIEQLEHVDSDLPGSSAALDYDLDGTVRRKYNQFNDKVNGKKIRQLLQGERVLLDRLDLDEFDTRIIARTLRNKNPKMEHLDLNSNRRLGPDGVNHLCEHVLTKNCNLTALFLSGCGLGDTGVVVLAEAIKINSSLEILELRHNTISHEAAPALAEALLENETLESLFLSNDQWCDASRQNCLGDVGVLVLADAVKERSRKLKVALQRNGISAETQAQVQQNLGRQFRF